MNDISILPHLADVSQTALRQTLAQLPVSPCDPHLKGVIRVMTRTAYDAQKLRTMTGNRLVQNFKLKLGIDTSAPEGDQEDGEGMKILGQLKKEYDRLADCFSSKKNRQVALSENRLLNSEVEYYLADEYFRMLEAEQLNFRNLGKVLKDVPIWTHFMEGVRGCGPAMAGVIISEIDPHKSPTAASIWSYAGLDVARDGRGRSRRAEHLVDRAYTAKDGSAQTKKSITFNPLLKTKLTGVLGGSFLKCKSPYADVYYDYKHRLQNHPAHKEKTDAHRHNMAIRYMVKRFLVDLYYHWRTLEGLPVTEEYSVRKLGMQHHA